MTEPPPRIPPVDYDAATDEQRQLLDALGGRKALNIFATMANHAGLFRRWLPFGGKLLQGGKLPPRDRELIILRVAYRCGADYEWAQHVSIAREAGLTDDEIARVAAGADAKGWSDDDGALLRAVDELHYNHRISDGTWAHLSARYSTEQMIEVPFLAGHYALLAGVLNSIGVHIDDVASGHALPEAPAEGR